MSEIQLAFEISGTCHQRIVPEAGWDEESIIQGLRDGTLATTTWFDYGQAGYIELIEDGTCVARILSQQIDGEYTDYR